MYNEKRGVEEEVVGEEEKVGNPMTQIPLQEANNISDIEDTAAVLTFRLLMSCIYMEHVFLMFLDHTQRRITVGRTPLDE